MGLLFEYVFIYLQLESYYLIQIGIYLGKKQLMWKLAEWQNRRKKKESMQIGNFPSAFSKQENKQIFHR